MRNIKWKASSVGIALSISLALSVPARADVACAFTVTDLRLNADGWLSGLFTGAVTRSWQMCPISGSTSVNTGYITSLTVNSDACKGFYTHFITAKSTGKQVTFYFNGPTDCSSTLPPNGSLGTSSSVPYPFTISF